jgi:hypothetical protein
LKKILEFIEVAPDEVSNNYDDEEQPGTSSKKSYSYQKLILKLSFQTTNQWQKSHLQSYKALPAYVRNDIICIDCNF